MAKINAMITSEIDGLSNTSKEMKNFLKWVLNFEKGNMDKESYTYTDEIQKKVKELVSTETEEESPEEKNVVHK